MRSTVLLHQKRSFKKVKCIIVKLLIFTLPLRRIFLSQYFKSSRLFVSRPWPLVPICISWPRPQICISRPQPSICICLFFVLQLKFVIVTMFTYINHIHKKRKGFSFLLTMYKLNVYLYILTCEV